MMRTLRSSALMLIAMAVVCPLMFAAGKEKATTPAPTSKPTPPPTTATAPNPQSAIRNSQSNRPRPFLALQVGHSGRITCLAFSPDGRTLATGGFDSTAKLWDVETGQLQATLEGHTYFLWALAFSPDGKTLATAALDNTARLWDVKSAQLKAVLSGHNRGVTSLAFSPDSKTVVTGGYLRGTARLWEVETGRLKAELPANLQRLSTLAFSPDGKTLVTGSDDATPRIWDLGTGQLKITLKGHTLRTGRIAISPDGKFIASGGEDKSPRLWEAESGQLKATLQAHTDPVFGLSFSPDGKLLATLSYRDKTARIWKAPSGQLHATLEHHDGVSAVSFSPDSKLIATATSEGAMVLWEVASGRPRENLQGHTGRVSAVQFSPDGRTLASGGEDMTVRLWDAATGQLKKALEGGGALSTAAVFSPDGTTLVTAGGELRAPGEVRLWDAASGQLKTTLRGLHGVWVWAVAFSPDGKTMATAEGPVASQGGQSGVARLWDATTGQPKATLQGHTEGVALLAFSPDGKTLATGSGDKTARLWVVPGGERRAELTGHTDGVKSLSFSPDGSVLATGGGRGDKTARLWEVSSGRLSAVLGGHMEQVLALAFSPDGKTILTGSDDRTARLWEVASGQLKATLPGHSNSVVMLAFSADGKVVATGDYDGTVRLWEAESGQLRLTLPSRPSVGFFGPGLHWLGFSKDGRIVVKYPDKTVRIWEAATGTPSPLSSYGQLNDFPHEIRRPLFGVGAAVSLHDPRDGHVLATMMPLPDVAETQAKPIPTVAKPITADAKPIESGATSTSSSSSTEYFVTTPEGYFDCSANAAKFIKWNVNGELYPAERYMRRFRRPDLVRQALRGERIKAPEMTGNDIPPAARFVNLKDGDLAVGDAVNVTVEVRDDRKVKDVELFVNGRPLPTTNARPITVDARPITVDAKDVDPNHRVTTQMSFRVPLPTSEPEIRLRAVAYDDTDLSSDPVEVVLKRASAQAVTGDLYVLAVGVSNYKNADGKGFKNLQFPAIDAQSIAERFQREGKALRSILMAAAPAGGSSAGASPSLYQHVHARVLPNEQATVANLRAGLKWLRDSTRPNGVDTVVLFLSGHGVSVPEKDGRFSYYYATHDIDLKNIPQTALSGRELKQALGAQLRARAVFVFMDTCHSGGMEGRNDDLAIELSDSVYVAVSSGAKQYSYEAKEWGHGAFTSGLLRALSRPQSDGLVRFNTVTAALPDEVASLMTAAGRNESEQEPRFRASGPLRVALATARR